MPIQNTAAILSTGIEVYEPYTLVRSGVFHYIDVVNDEKSLFTSSTKLESSPNVVFYSENSETKMMLDYTNASDKDKKYLDILFSNLNDFSGLSFTNATYLNEKEGIVDKSLTTSLLFRQFKNNIIFGKVLSSVDSGDLNKVFLGDYFIDIPVLTTDSSWNNKTSETSSLIVNSNPKTQINFDEFSINAGDLVEIVNPDSVNTQQRFEIDSYTTLNNKQIIKLKTPAQQENLIGRSTVLNFYTKTKVQNLKSLELDNELLGCCKDLKTSVFYNKTTELECHIRTNGAYTHSKNVACSVYSDVVPLPTININSTVIKLQKAEYVIYDKNNLEEIYVSIADNKFLLNGINYDTFPLFNGKMYKFIQNDETNVGYPLRFSRTINTNLTTGYDFYQQNTFGVVYPEGVGSEVYLKITNNTPLVLYMFTENNVAITGPTLVITQ